MRTLESFEWSSLDEISIYVFLSTVYFLRFLCESDLRIFCLKEAMKQRTEIKQRYLQHF